jgi:predicted transposase YdaD
MQEYDVALKLLLRNSATRFMNEVTGGVPIARWLDIELPKLQNLRMDLLGEAVDGGLFHLELQSRNDAAMHVRMAEYCLGIFRLCGSLPRQILLYVGEAPLRMETELRGPDVLFRYHALDIRTLDGDRLLESPALGDNVIAVLAKLGDQKQAVRKIVKRIAQSPPAEQSAALAQLLILAGLRRLEDVVEEEVRKMPLEIDILENRVLGREYKRGKQDGEREGEMRGEQRGKLGGELIVLRRLIEKRFGPIPTRAEERLGHLTTKEIEDLCVRVIDAASIEDLLR